MHKFRERSVKSELLRGEKHGIHELLRSIGQRTRHRGVSAKPELHERDNQGRTHGQQRVESRRPRPQPIRSLYYPLRSGTHSNLHSYMGRLAPIPHLFIHNRSHHQHTRSHHNRHSDRPSRLHNRWPANRAEKAQQIGHCRQEHIRHTVDEQHRCRANRQDRNPNLQLDPSD